MHFKHQNIFPQNYRPLIDSGIGKNVVEFQQKSAKMNKVVKNYQIDILLKIMCKL